MAIHIITLGSPHATDEGLRIGAVRRAPGAGPVDPRSPEGYDVWFPTLAPSMETLRLAQEAKTDAQRAACAMKYRAEMARAESSQALLLLASLSHDTNIAVACYADDRFPFHQIILSELLAEKGASFAGTPGAGVVAPFRATPRLAVDNAGVVLSFPGRIGALG